MFRSYSAAVINQLPEWYRYILPFRAIEGTGLVEWRTATLIEQATLNLGAAGAQKLVQEIIAQQHRRDEVAYFDYIGWAGIDPAALRDSPAEAALEKGQTTLDRCDTC